MAISGDRVKEWLKFFAGLLSLAAVIGFLGSGISPPGALGEVLRHNQRYDIDATPLFYSEVENMAELEQGACELIKQTDDFSD